MDEGSGAKIRSGEQSEYKDRDIYEKQDSPSKHMGEGSGM